MPVGSQVGRSSSLRSFLRSPKPQWTTQPGSLRVGRSRDDVLDVPPRQAPRGRAPRGAVGTRSIRHQGV
eukprot:4665839-Alexandrium_andersonii.AAC.1